MNKVLFVSVHLDDETLGCGGTILKHKKLGDEIHWLNISDVTPNHPFAFTSDFIEERKKMFKRISEAYSFASSKNLHFPTQLLDEIPQREMIVKISEVMETICPQCLYLPNRSDIHSDHRIAFQAAYSSAKTFRKPFIIKIMMYETLSETEFAPGIAENAFIPNMFVDISEFMKKKLNIFSLYKSEVMPNNQPRSLSAIKALAAYRGSRIG